MIFFYELLLSDHGARKHIVRLRRHLGHLGLSYVLESGQKGQSLFAKTTSIVPTRKIKTNSKSLF